MAEEYLVTKVTHINGRYHCRLIDTRSAVVVDEMACINKADTGYCCAEMLRWHDKLGGQSRMAHQARWRMSEKRRTATGKVLYKGEIEAEKKKR